jgi:nucleoside triphosphatase YtkD
MLQSFHLYPQTPRSSLPLILTLNYKNENDMPNGNHVLAIPVYNNQLLFTNHQHRGIEFPGGKVEISEQSKEAVIRELYEETGAIAIYKRLIMLHFYTILCKIIDKFCDCPRLFV